MSISNNCKRSTVCYSNDSALENYPCAVKITDGEILVEYEDEGWCNTVVRMMAVATSC